MRKNAVIDALLIIIFSLALLISGKASAGAGIVPATFTQENGGAAVAGASGYDF